MPLMVEKNVLRLQVSIQNALLMKSLQGLHHLCNVKESLFLSQRMVLLRQEEEELASYTEVHYQKQLRLALKSPIEIDDKWRPLQLSIDLAFSYNCAWSHVVKKELFVHHLNCIHVSAVFLPGHKHGGISSLSNHLQQLKIVDCHIGGVLTGLNRLIVHLNQLVLVIRLGKVDL